MALKVRPATTADVPILVEFNRRLAAETEGKVLDVAVLTAGVEAGLADPAKARYFVVEDGLEVLGQLMLTTEWSDWRNGTVWWIQSVYVRAAARRRGVFRMLYEEVERIARATPGVIGLRLYVEYENRAAQQTYECLGMERAGYCIYQRWFA